MSWQGGGSQRGLVQLFLHPLLRVVVVLPGRLPPLLTIRAGAVEGVDVVVLGVVVLGVAVGQAGRASVDNVARGRLGSARSAQGVLRILSPPPPSPSRLLGCRNLGPNDVVLLLDHHVLVLLLLVLLRVH